ncbi:hypothetical protein SEA_XENIA2_95 [Gordonia phage Xenia2]
MDAIDAVAKALGADPGAKVEDLVEEINVIKNHRNNQAAVHWQHTVCEELGFSEPKALFKVVDEIKRLKRLDNGATHEQYKKFGRAICDAMGYDYDTLSDDAIIAYVKATKEYGDDGERFTKQVAEVLGVDWGTSRQSSLLEQIRQLKDRIQAEAVDRFTEKTSIDNLNEKIARKDTPYAGHLGEAIELPGPTEVEIIETPAERLLWSLMGQLADNLSNAEAKAGLEAIVKNLLEEIKTK